MFLLTAHAHKHNQNSEQIFTENNDEYSRVSGMKLKMVVHASKSVSQHTNVQFWNKAFQIRHQIKEEH